MNKHSAVSWFAGKTIFNREPVICILFFRDQVALRFAKTDQHTVPDDKGRPFYFCCIHCRNIYLPSCEIFAIEELRN